MCSEAPCPLTPPHPPKRRYERGLFVEAASAFSAAAACAEAGLPQDIHARAALLTNAAACLRRARKPAEAVALCDGALALLPRFGRALFRKAACLLEDGKPAEAVASFEGLYRCDATGIARDAMPDRRAKRK